jgi:hypothetical protein
MGWSIVLPNSIGITLHLVDRRNLASTFDPKFSLLKVLQSNPELETEHGLRQLSLINSWELFHLFYGRTLGEPTDHSIFCLGKKQNISMEK